MTSRCLSQLNIFGEISNTMELRFEEVYDHAIEEIGDWMGCLREPKFLIDFRRRMWFACKTVSEIDFPHSETLTPTKSDLIKLEKLYMKYEKEEEIMWKAIGRLPELAQKVSDQLMVVIEKSCNPAEVSRSLKELPNKWKHVTALKELLDKLERFGNHGTFGRDTARIWGAMKAMDDHKDDLNVLIYKVGKINSILEDWQDDEVSLRFDHKMTDT